MPPPIYTVLIDAQEVLAYSDSSPVSVPDGFQWVVRTFSGIFGEGVDGGYVIARSGAHGGGFPWNPTEDGSNQCFVINGHWVIEAGDFIEIFNNTSGVLDYQVSGYQLSTP